MYLAPLNYDRFFRKVFSDPKISKKFLEDFLEVEIEEFEILKDKHRITDDAAVVEFDFRCKIKGAYVIVDMQQWYKQDIFHRFYMYHTLNTALQLDKLPEKGVSIDTITHKLKKIKDYQALEPVITLVWMVDDSLGFSENYISYVMTPENVLEFVRDKNIWIKPDIQELMERRARILKIIENEEKGIPFITANRLVFLLQPNIVKNKPHTRYERWFQFAERSRKAENSEKDFDDFRDDEVFLEIIRRLDKSVLPPEEIRYIEDEKEYFELTQRYEKGVFNNGLKEGIEKGEKRKALEIARALKSMGYMPDAIVSATQLDLETIAKL